jgi:electron transfer flavoprotein alpha subunit
MPAILAVAVLRDGVLSTPTREILGMARRIAEQTGDQVATALIGAGVSSFAQELIASGTDVVYGSEKDPLREFHTNLYGEILEHIAAKVKPHIVIFPGETTVMDLASRLAFRLGAGLVTDCIDFEIQSGRLLLTKPVYGGKALAKMSAATPRIVVTVRPRSQAPLARDPRRKGKLIMVEVPTQPRVPDLALVRRVEGEKEEGNLEDARVVVSGGRGIGGAEGFQELRQLAKILDGALGATRAAVDAGWAPPSSQVGQTGKIVAPDIYFAIALSGSSQHLAGMTGSKVIVAINRDPDAPIFRAANVGVVDDYRNVLTGLVGELEKILSK